MLNPAYRRSLLRYLVAADVDQEKPLNHLGCNTVIDIGANRGQFALAARHCFPNARIISFEPLAAPARRFEAVFSQDPLVTLHRAAIGPTKNKQSMNVAREDDASSLLAIGPAQTELFPSTTLLRTEMIDVAPLSDFVGSDELRSPAMLKIDVQGFELDVLRGCEPLLSSFAYIYAECSFVELYTGQALAHEVIAWLHQRGFDFRGIHNMVYGRSRQPIQADFLFCRTKS